MLSFYSPNTGQAGQFRKPDSAGAKTLFMVAKKRKGKNSTKYGIQKYRIMMK